MTILKKLLSMAWIQLKRGFNCSSQLKNVFNKAFNKIALFLINFYRVYLSNYSKGSCRFHPTCSTYARDAYTKHSFLNASQLVTCRLLKCRPFGPQGFDPLPIRTSSHGRK